MVKVVKVIWTEKAIHNLKSIHSFYSRIEIDTFKTILRIIESMENIIFTEQYQEDEILGLPFRRYFVKNYKILYKSENNFISIVRIIDSRQNPYLLKEPAIYK